MGLFPASRCGGGADRLVHFRGILSTSRDCVNNVPLESDTEAGKGKNTNRKWGEDKHKVDRSRILRGSDCMQIEWIN